MFPVVLIAVLLDQSELNKYFPNCLFQYFLDIECWGCGMTRAILEIGKLNFTKAISLNSLSPIVLILIWLIFCNEVFNKGKKKWLNSQLLNNK
jgi:hypothetical protein